MIFTGQKIECVNKGRSKGVTVGKIYTAWNTRMRSVVYIDNDEGERRYYPIKNFKLVNGEQ